MTRTAPARIGMIGFGAIGSALAERLAADPEAPQITDVLLRPGRRAAGRERLAGGPAGHPALHEDIHALLASAPALVVECAGVSAAASLLPPVLERGIDVLVASIGVFASPDGAARIEAAARAGRARVHLCSGAVGGIDLLAAAGRAGLESVTYTARKPPAAWRGTAAEEVVDLNGLTSAVLLYEGTARAASQIYPKNANVATTIALGGLGLDRTRVRIFADPDVVRNVHEIHASGAFGHITLRVENLPLPGNPKTSFLTVLSLEQAIRQGSGSIVL